MTASFTVKCPWGWWDSRGYWYHNPRLAMTYEQQKQENERNGYACKIGGI